MIRGVGYRQSLDILGYDDENMKTGDFDDDRSPSPPPGSGRPPTGRARHIAGRPGLVKGPAASAARSGWSGAELTRG